MNQIPNLRRNDVRRIRAMLHAWEKYGHERAQQVHYSKYATKSRLPSKENPHFEEILRGMLAFFKSIKGEADQVYQNLARQFNRVAKRPIVVRDINYICRQSTWIIEDGNSCIQGTGFFLDDAGFITCAHCVGSDPYIYQPAEPTKRRKASLVAKDDTIDLAILSVENHGPKSGLTAGQESRSPQYLETVTLVGYPSHAPGREISIKRGEVVSFAVKSGIRRFNISSAIVVGNSGGPVLDKQLRVVGVAVTGADREDAAQETEDHGVIPIQALSQLNRCEPN